MKLHYLLFHLRPGLRKKLRCYVEIRETSTNIVFVWNSVWRFKILCHEDKLITPLQFDMAMPKRDLSLRSFPLIETFSVTHSILLHLSTARYRHHKRSFVTNNSSREIAYSSASTDVIKCEFDWWLPFKLAAGFKQIVSLIRSPEAIMGKRVSSWTYERKTGLKMRGRQ